MGLPLPTAWPTPEAEAPPVPASDIPVLDTVEMGLETVETGGEPMEEPSTSRTRAEAALLRMVPPKDEWAVENRPAPAERVSVREEWAGPETREEARPPAPEPTVAAAPVVAAAPPEPARASDDPIIPWLAPVAASQPVRPAPPSLEAKAEEGPIIVPRDYDEKAGRQRRGRRRAGKGRGPLLDLNAFGRSIKPSWILAIAGVILLTLIVFAIFPPGGGSGDAAGSGGINRFTGMPIHTVATPARPSAATPAAAATTEATATPVGTDTPWPTETAPPATSRQAPVFGVLPGVTVKATTPAPEATAATGDAGAPGLRVVISSAGGWSGTIGQQGETYTETPVVGSGDQVRTITGPATMVTANIQKLDASTDPLEVRVERDGVVLKRGSTTEPTGIVVLSVQV
jgi:hypothetical protein